MTSDAARADRPAWAMSACEMAEMIASSRTTSREVVQAHLDRIAETNGQLNALVEVLTDTALASADAADAAVTSGGTLGPLHGVPFTVKANVDVAGSASTNGVAAFAGAVPEADSPIVERLGGPVPSRSAGPTCPTSACV